MHRTGGYTAESLPANAGFGAGRKSPSETSPRDLGMCRWYWADSAIRPMPYNTRPNPDAIRAVVRPLINSWETQAADGVGLASRGHSQDLV